VAFIEERSELKAVRDTLLSPPDTSADFQLSERAARIGDAGTILVGERADLGYLSRGLVRFDANALPDSGASITEGTLSIVYLGGIRPGAPSFTMSLHRVAESWSEASMDTSHAFPPFDAAPFQDVSLDAPAARDTLEIPLTLLVQRWIDEPDSNFGVALIPAPDAGSLPEFGSSESGSPPRLLWKTASDSASIDRPQADTFFPETTGTFVPLAGPDPGGAPGRLTVGRGFPSRSLLRFAFPDFGDRVTINRAVLTLHLDHALSDFTDSTAMKVKRVEDEVWSGASTDTTIVVDIGTVRATDDSVAIAVTELVAESVRDGNFGFLLLATDERPDVDFFRFHSEESADPFKHPSLRVWYTPGDQPGAQP
jgi:hypothetical protein